MKKIDFNILQCPECGGKLILKKDCLECADCSKEYEIRNGKICFVKYTPKAKKGNEVLDYIRPLLKKTGKFYYLLTYLFSPVCPSNFKKKYIDKYIKENDSVIALNIGSANSRLGENILNIDLLPYSNVDILADINKLPFKDGTVDSIICEAVLEHIKFPEKVVAEFFRVLKNKGTIYTFVPFICGFHASPDDFHRWTIEGVRNLFKDFDIIESKPIGGPTSALLWILQEWLAIVFSFGNSNIRQVMFLFFMILTFPFKYLDFLIIKHPDSKNISFGFGIIVRKK